jgi:DNA replication and repair protein RecF
VGKNGMGKTNLLDAIYYLAVGKNYAGLPDTYLAEHDTDFFRLEGRFLIQGKKEKVVAKVIPRQKKVLERNDVPYDRISEHLGLIPIVYIAPDDTAIVKEGSEVRRKFLDNTLSQINRQYLQQLITYNRILKQRNALLKQFAEDQTFNAGLVRVYNDQMAEPAQYLFQERKAFIDRFNEILMKVVAKLSSENESVSCEYQSQLYEGAICDLLLEVEEKDRLLARTTVGIHKDDLRFRLEKLPLKRFASQGQLKTFVLALKLAQYELLKEEKKELPLLLLDDIFDKLDRSRVENLLEYIQQHDFGQVFITDTHPDRIVSILDDFELEYQKYIIRDGTAKA